MSYRYNTTDIAVGVGMCAIFFGALLFFAAANGTYQTAPPQLLASPRPMGLDSGMVWLQPTLGRAIVDQALFERRTDRALALATSDWSRATLAQQEFLSQPAGPFGTVRRHAIAIPADHMARVQAIMGHAIVNFTLRGVRNGLLSADQSRSIFNLDMIRKIEIRGLLLHDQFTSTWQATLGRHIVETSQNHWRQAETIQEQLGTAVIHLTQAQIESEQGRAMQQEKLGSLVFAAVRTETPTDQAVSATVAAPMSEPTAVTFTEPAAWPEIPLAYLIVATCMLAIVFLMGLSWAARSREEKELARIRYDASRLVYRTVS